MRKLHTLTFNETTYTFVETHRFNGGIYTIIVNGVETHWYLHFQPAFEQLNTNQFRLYTSGAILGDVSHYIPAETDEITLNLLCEVINIINK
jgi:hypothetical protein